MGAEAGQAASTGPGPGRIGMMVTLGFAGVLAVALAGVAMGWQSLGRVDDGSGPERGGPGRAVALMAAARSAARAVLAESGEGDAAAVGERIGAVRAAVAAGGAPAGLDDRLATFEAAFADAHRATRAKAEALAILVSAGRGAAAARSSVRALADETGRLVAAAGLVGRQGDTGFDRAAIADAAMALRDAAEAVAGPARAAHAAAVDAVSAAWPAAVAARRHADWAAGLSALLDRFRTERTTLLVFDEPSAAADAAATIAGLGAVARDLVEDVTDPSVRGGLIRIAERAGPMAADFQSLAAKVVPRPGGGRRSGGEDGGRARPVDRCDGRLDPAPLRGGPG